MPVPSRKERQAETRRRLLAAAARVFADQGFHGTSVSAVAAAAGYTTGALYANFESKEALFLALVDEHVAAQVDALDDLGPTSGPAALAAELTARIEGHLRGLTAADGPPATAASDEGAGAEPDDDEPPAASADDALSPVQLQTLTLEFLLYAVRERPDLRAALAARYRRIDARTAEAFAGWLAAHGHDAALGADDLALAHSWLIEGLALRLLVDPELTSPARAARLWRTLVADLPLTGPAGAAAAEE